MGKFFFQSWTQNLGRNGWDQPMAIPEDMSAESFNIELREGGLGKKRSGFESEQLTGLAGGGTEYLAKFVPNNDATASELFLINNSTYLYRIPGSASSGVQLSTSIDTPITYAQLDGKFFLGSDSAANRIKVYAPNESTTTIRDAGLKPGGAPTVADFGAGTYPAVLRYYRVRFRAKVGGVVVRTSEASASTAFTPSGVGAAARITQGTLPGEGETHWVIEGSQDGNVFWELYEVAIATTTYDDSNNPPNYPSIGLVPPLVGECYPFPSCKYLFSDGVRLFGLGVYETSAGDSVAPVNGRLYFTPAIGSSDLGDSERIVNTSESSGWIDVAVGAGGSDTGIGGPINNAVVTFQTDRVTMFIPTGNAQTPFRRENISNQVGAVSGSIVMAEDESGQPALYFIDPRSGPYRIGSGYQLQWLGKDVKDIWDARDKAQAVFVAYDSARKLIVWRIGVVSGVTTRQEFIVFDVTNGRVVGPNEVRKGWTRWTMFPGFSDVSVTSLVMFPSSLSVTHPATESMYLGYRVAKASTAFVYRSSSSATKDGGILYQAHIKSRAYRWPPLGRLKRVLEAVVVAKARAATDVVYSLIANWGTRTYSQTVSVAGIGSEEYVRPRPSPEDMTDLVTVQVQIGDSAAVDNSWEIEATEMQVEELEQAR